MATYAAHWGPEALLNSSGTAIAAATAYTVMNTGTSTPATLWTTRTKTTSQANPGLTIDARLNAEFFADVAGFYDIWMGGVLFVPGLEASADPADIAPSLASQVLYVDASNGLDTRAGRTPGSAKLTVAAALTALGATAGVVNLTPETHTLAAGIVVPARQRIVCDSPDGAVLTYAGTGTAVTLSGGRMCSLRGIKVLTTNAAATVIGVKIDASSASCNYWRLNDLTISATTKVTGQVGLLLINSATTSIYWGLCATMLVENFGTGIKFTNDATFGINANNFSATKVHNADTCLDLGTSDGNVFAGLLMDVFSLGISCAGGHCQILGARAEGGASSKTYDFTSTSTENLLVVDDNSPTTSTDTGTDNNVVTLRAGQTKAWDKLPSYLAPFYPLLATTDGTVPSGANNAQWVKLEPILKVQSLVGVIAEVTVQSGNYDVGLFELVGTNLVRRASSGGSVVPAVGRSTPNFSASATVRPGKTYYLAISADNVTAKFKALPVADSVFVDVTGNNVVGKLLYASSTAGMYPLPSTVALAGLTNDAKAFCILGR